MTRSKETPPTVRAPIEKQLDLVVTQASPRKGKAFLMVSTGDAAGTVFPLTQASLLIGRSPEAEVRVNEQAISNEHARLETDGARFTVRDLGSTNGTYVNGQRIVEKVNLEGGDTIRTGSTTFTFVTREAGIPAGTVKLRDPHPDLPVMGRDHSRRPQAHSVAVTGPPESEPADSLSLTDVVHTVQTYWVYVKRYIWLATTCMCFGIAFGIVQARLNPPPGSAWFEMTLKTESRGNDEKEGMEFFVAAESTFRSLPLIKKTLAELGATHITDTIAANIQAALTFELVGYNSKLWRGDYKDATAELAVIFLKKHLDVYVNSEIDKILKVLRADAEFDREQEARANQQVAEARNRLLEFIDEHPEAVPKDAKLPAEPRLSLAPGASPERVKKNIASAERALRAAYSSIQSKKARPYLEQAAQADAKAAEAKSRGLTDQHPDVKNSVNLANAMRAKASQILSSEPTQSEQSLDGEVLRLQQELAELKSRLAQAPGPGANGAGGSAAAGGDANSATRGAPVVTPVSAEARPDSAPRESLAQLKLQYAEMAREYERAKTDHEALLKKRETTDRQLERERTSAEARYDIITPPTPTTASLLSTTLKRAGMGGAIGLGLAMVAAACLELRRTLIARGHL